MRYRSTNYYKQAIAQSYWDLLFEYLDFDECALEVIAIDDIMVCAKISEVGYAILEF